MHEDCVDALTHSCEEHKSGIEFTSLATENIFSNYCVRTLDLIGHIMVGPIAVQNSGKFPP